MFSFMTLSTLMMTMSIILSMSMSNWMSMWMFMEMNMLSFIPMMSKNKIIEPMNYFMIQAFSSMMMSFFMMTMMMNSNTMNNETIKTLMLMTLTMKLGILPFHSWFVSMMNKLTWMKCFMLSTTQKIIPMMMMMMINETSNKMTYLTSMNMLFSSIMGMNQTSMKMIMAFSSMFYTSWMLIMMEIEMMWTKFIMIYTMISMKIFKIMSKTNMLSMNNLYQMKPNMKMNLMICNMSMMGLPPMFGFMNKWISNYMNETPMLNPALLLMMMTSTMSMMFYLNMTMSSMIMNNSKIKLLNTKKTKNYSITMMSFMSMWMLTLNELM